MRRVTWLGAAVVVLALAASSCASDGSGPAEPRAEAARTTTTGAAAGPGGSFTALTYNVAGLPQGVNADQHPEDNQPVMSPLLNAYDVVVLQEDFGSYTALLRAEADHEYQSEPHPGATALNPIHRESALVGDGLNVLSRLPIDPLVRVPWQTCAHAAADCLALKGFAGTTLRLDPDDPENGPSLDLYDLHMEAGSEEADNVARGDDLDDLAAYLAEHSADRAVIVGGDWNLSYSEEPDGRQLRRFARRAGLQDVCDVLDCGADDDVIDRFFFRSGGGVDLVPVSHTFERDTFVDARGGPLSDHDPLAVEWRWTVATDAAG